MENMDSPHLTLEDLVAEVNGESLDEGAREHLAACSDCQKELERWKTVAEGVRDIFNGAPGPSGSIASWTTEVRPSSAQDSSTSSRIRRKKLVAGVAAGIVVLGGVGFGISSRLGGSKAVPSENLSNIVLASYSQATKSTAKITIDVKTGQTETTGSGAFNFPNRTGSLNLTTREASGATVQTEMIVSGNAAYTSVPKQPGKWVEVPLIATSNSGGSNEFQFLDKSSAKTTLQLLAQSGLTEKASTLDGQPADEYSGSLDVSKISKQKGILLPASVADLPPLQISILVNKAGTTEQIRTVLNPPAGSPLNPLGPITETITFSDFGTKVSVSPPPQSDVIKKISLPNSVAASGGSPSA